MALGPLGLIGLISRESHATHHHAGNLKGARGLKRVAWLGGKRRLWIFQDAVRSSTGELFSSRCELVHTPRLISKRFLSRTGAAIQIGARGAS